MDAAQTIWLEQLEELQRDLDRVNYLLDASQLAEKRGLQGRLGLNLSPLIDELKALHKSEEGGLKPEHWRELAENRRRCRAATAAQLEILGGTSLGLGEKPLDGGIAALAEGWLNALRADAGISGDLVVVSGRGPLLEVESGLVRLPFLDQDGYALAPLARAIGLLAAGVGGDYRDALDKIVTPIVGRIERLNTNEPLNDLPLLLPEVVDLAHELQRASPQTCTALTMQLPAAANRLRRCYEYLFADIIATALAGPAYALAVFTLQFDYRNPNSYQPEDPDLTEEERKQVPLVVPTPAQRAAAILLTLQAMNQNEDRPHYQDGPYTQVCRQLEELWNDAEDATTSSSLQRELEHLKPLCRAIYEEVVARLMHRPTQQTTRHWQDAQKIAAAMAGESPAPANRPDLTAVLGAIWLCRLRYPDCSEPIRTLASQIMAGRGMLVPLPGPAYDLSALTVGIVRHRRLETRLRILEQILRPMFGDPKCSVIAGRFFRSMSEQSYALEGCATLLHAMRDGKMRPGGWQKLSKSAEQEIPLLREALEFLGGVRVREHEQDCEPASIAGIRKDGPSICALADRLLGDLAQVTGVNWNAQTIPGGDPFLATDTEVIRVRFPGWSLEELPLMAHEIGHLVARATPAFRDYQARPPQIEVGQPREVTRADEYLALRRNQFEELFADLFAAYACGPAFACTVIHQQFNPAEAYAWRTAHPTYQERVRSILWLLDWMGQRERERGNAGGWEAAPYSEALTLLKEHWDAALASASATPAEPEIYAARLATTERWARDIATLLDRYYRLGAAFTLERWERAKELAPRLFDPGYPAALTAPGSRRARDDLGDLIMMLNTLWWARLTRPEQATSVRQAAYLVGLAFVETKP